MLHQKWRMRAGSAEGEVGTWDWFDSNGMQSSDSACWENTTCATSSSQGTPLVIWAVGVACTLSAELRGKLLRIQVELNIFKNHFCLIPAVSFHFAVHENRIQEDWV